MRVVLAGLCLILSSCATQSVITVVSRADRQVVNGTLDSISRAVGITLRGRNYRGDYVLTPTAQTTVVVNNTGNNADRKGNENRSRSTVQRSPNGSGKMLLISDDGDSLRCDFTYEDDAGLFKAIGTCTDNARLEYDLRITSRYVDL